MTVLNASCDPLCYICKIGQICTVVDRCCSYVQNALGNIGNNATLNVSPIAGTRNIFCFRKCFFTFLETLCFRNNCLLRAQTGKHCCENIFRNMRALLTSFIHLMSNHTNHISVSKRSSFPNCHPLDTFLSFPGRNWSRRRHWCPVPSQWMEANALSDPLWVTSREKRNDWQQYNRQQTGSVSIWQFKGPVHTNPDKFEAAIFFCPVWPSVPHWNDVFEHRKRNFLKMLSAECAPNALV